MSEAIVPMTTAESRNAALCADAVDDVERKGDAEYAGWKQEHADVPRRQSPARPPCTVPPSSLPSVRSAT